MSMEGKCLDVVGFRASAAIAENAAVTIDTSASAYPGDVVVKTAGATDEILGINSSAVAAGQTAAVAIRGYGKLVKLGATPGTVTVGAKIKADASGLGQVTTTALDQLIGTSLSNGGSAGDEIPVILTPLTYFKAAS